MSERQTGSEAGFQRRLAALLLTFFGVAALDLLVVSPLTGHLRVWFPVWLDPAWDTRPDGLIVYSQSYIAGICLIPVLLHAVDRELLGGQPRSRRAAVWATGLVVLGFIAWWKGGLMLQYDKGWEALGWLAATIVVWGLVWQAQTLPRRIAGLSRAAVVRGFLLALAGFFLVMAVLDPAIQVGVHGLSWSTGLLIEIGFFIPAGAVCALLARRMRRAA